MTTTAKKAKMTSVGTALAAGEAKITTHRFLSGVTALGLAQIVTAEAGTTDDAEPAWIEGDPSEILCVPLELPEDSIIQATILQFMAWGK